MSTFEFECWFDDETEDDADTVMMPRDDAEDAAREFVEGRVSGNADYSHHIDGDALRVHTRRAICGTERVWDVRIVTSIDYYADEVSEAKEGGDGK